MLFVNKYQRGVVMPRAKKITVCILNVIIQEKDKRNYAKLLNKCAKQHEIVQFNRTHAASLIAVRDYTYQDKTYKIGSIYKFVNVKPPYFDIDKSEVIVDSDGNPKDLISPSIRSNTREVAFCFFEDIHRIFVDTRNINPLMARDFFQRIFNSEYITDAFGQVDVSLHSKHGTVDNILNIHSIKRIDLVVSRPNPIGLNRFEADVEENLRKQNVEKLYMGLKTRHGGLNPDESTRAHMYAAARQGSVFGSGENEDGTKVEFDTEKTPFRHSMLYHKGDIPAEVLIMCSRRAWNEDQE